MRRQTGLGFGRYWLVILGLLLSVLPLQAQEDWQVMQEVLQELTAKTGQSFVGSGSWIDGKNFVVGHSDFDLRFLPTGNVAKSAQLSLREWESAQMELTAAIKRKFGPRAASILEQTNLYPADQITLGVNNNEAAKELFRRVGRMPNLKDGGRFNEAARFDGIWGEGAIADRKKREAIQGNLFARSSVSGKGKIYSSKVAHRLEVHMRNARFTPEGSASVTSQWADLGFLALDAGDSHDLAKYLGRLDDTLQRCRRLSGFDLDQGFVDFVGEVQRLQARLQSDPSVVQDPQVLAAAKRLLVRGKAESALLANYSQAGPIQRAYLRVMMDSVAARDQLGQAIEAIGAHTPDWVNFTNAVKFMAIASATPDVAAAVGRGDNEEAARLVTNLLSTSSIKGFSLPSLLASVPGLSLAVLAKMIVEIRVQAIEGADLLAVGRQDAWDLISGVYTAWGIGSDADPRFFRDRTVHDLVIHLHTESRLESFVRFMAERAANQGARPPEWGPLTQATVERVAAAIFERCWPTILYAWRWERDLLMQEYLGLRSELLDAPMLLESSPDSPELHQAVTFTVHPLEQSPEAVLQRMEQILRILYGREAYIYRTYLWEPAGSPAVAGRTWQRNLTWSEPGSHVVTATLQFTPNVPNLDYRDFEPALADVLLVAAPSGAAEDADFEELGEQATEASFWQRLYLASSRMVSGTSEILQDAELVPRPEKPGPSLEALTTYLLLKPGEAVAIGEIEIKRKAVAADVDGFWVLEKPMRLVPPVQPRVEKKGARTPSYTVDYTHDVMGDAIFVGGLEVAGHFYQLAENPADGSLRHDFTYAAKGSVAWEPLPSIVPNGTDWRMMTKLTVQESCTPSWEIASQGVHWISKAAHLIPIKAGNPLAPLIRQVLANESPDTEFELPRFVPCLMIVSKESEQVVRPRSAEERADAVASTVFAKRDDSREESVLIKFPLVPPTTVQTAERYVVTVDAVTPGGTRTDTHTYRWVRELPDDRQQDLRRELGRPNFVQARSWILDMTGGRLAQPVEPAREVVAGAASVSQLRHLPETLVAGQEAAFEVTVANAPEEPSYAWFFGVGPATQANQWTPTSQTRFTYREPGTYTVRVTVRDKVAYARGVLAEGKWEVTVVPK